MPGGTDAEHMDAALAAADLARFRAPPNPWVGAVVVSPSGKRFEGSTLAPGGAHAEIEALAAAGSDARDATLYSTLEPCVHHGRTPPCVDAIVAAGVRRVVIAVEDPDPAVKGRGVETLRAAGITVDVGVGCERVETQLAPYLHHRRTGRPYVVLKLASTLDGRTAAADGSSQWITGSAARADVHRLRAESDAVLVGAGTVRADNPRLTVRDFQPPPGTTLADIQPQRVVLGRLPPGAAVAPALELSGPPDAVLADLGSRGVLQLLVEGGPRVAGDFHRAGLVDRYVLYIAPALVGGDDARPLFSGRGAPTIGDLWRGQMVDVIRVGDDLRVEMIRPRYTTPG